MSVDDLFDILIIRVKVGFFAMKCNINGTYTPICLMSKIKYNDKYDCIAEVQYINFFGVAMFPKIIQLKSK